MNLQIVAVVLAAIFGTFGLLRWSLQTRERSERRSEERFRRILARMRNDRSSLQRAAGQLLGKRRPEAQSTTNSHLFALSGWIHEVPVPLERLNVAFSESEEDSIPSPPTARLPRTIIPFECLSQCIQKLAPPREFNDYPHYRLLDIEPLLLQFSRKRSSYFQKIDFGQYLEYFWLHQRVPLWLRRGGSIRLWRTISQPRDYVVLAGVCTLTLLHDGSTLRFLMHQRGKLETATGMGSFHVIPAGEFQPACEAPASFEKDLDVWKSMMREYAEEVANAKDYDGHSNVPFNYDLPPYAELERERKLGNILLFYFGTGLDPISLQAEILTVAVFKEETFNRIFPVIQTVNREGKINTDGSRWGHPFTADECSGYMSSNTLASAQLLLALALRNKSLFHECFTNPQGPHTGGA
jgi:type II secretory pathway pseudopilin PulG